MVKSFAVRLVEMTTQVNSSFHLFHLLPINVSYIIVDIVHAVPRKGIGKRFRTKRLFT